MRANWQECPSIWRRWYWRRAREPLQAGPVVIEDNCFIGARSEVVEGVVVEEGAVLSMGVFIGASTKIVNRVTGEVHMGRVPAYSVVVPGTLPGKPLADGTLAHLYHVLLLSSRLMSGQDQKHL